MITAHLTRGLDGPWPCEKCGQLSQFAEQSAKVNRIYCMNPYCQYKRVVDKQKQVVLENDGTVWRYDHRGHKTRVRHQ